MAIQTSSSLKVELNWSQRDTGTGGNNSQDNVSMTQTTALTNGTGTGQINTVWFGNGTLNSGETTTIDMWNLSRTLLGGSLTTSFSGGSAKNIVIENTSTGSTQVLALINTDSNHMKSYSNGSGCTLLIQPNTMFAINHPTTGYTVNSTNRYFKLSGQASGCTYEVGIVGSV